VQETVVTLLTSTLILLTVCGAVSYLFVGGQRTRPATSAGRSTISGDSLAGYGATPYGTATPYGGTPFPTTGPNAVHPSTFPAGYGQPGPYPTGYGEGMPGAGAASGHGFYSHGGFQGSSDGGRGGGVGAGVRHPHYGGGSYGDDHGGFHTGGRDRGGEERWVGSTVSQQGAPGRGDVGGHMGPGESFKEGLRRRLRWLSHASGR
jgi:hypothetical protein